MVGRAISTLRLSTQPPKIDTDNMVTVKCFAPQSPLIEAKDPKSPPTPLWSMNKAVVFYTDTDGTDAGKFSSLVTMEQKSSKFAAASDDGLMQITSNLGSRPKSGFGIIKVQWTVSATKDGA